jgi:hypothetical protein
LFNGQIGDGHFSPLGSELWANCVARRLASLLEKEAREPAHGDLPSHETTAAAGQRSAHGDRNQDE